MCCINSFKVVVFSVKGLTVDVCVKSSVKGKEFLQEVRWGSETEFLEWLEISDTRENDTSLRNSHHHCCATVSTRG